MITIRHLQHVAEAINSGMDFYFLGGRDGDISIAIKKEDYEFLKKSESAVECAFGLILPDDDHPRVMFLPQCDFVRVKIVKTNPHDGTDEVLASGVVPVDILNECGTQYQDTYANFFWADEEWEAIES